LDRAAGVIVARPECGIVTEELESVRYLPHAPRNFREIVLADLLRAQRLILRIQDEIDPQFRIASPEGDWWIGMTLDPNLEKREQQMRLVSRFMQWKLSPAFTMASEIKVPDAVYCVGVSNHECHGVMSLILRNPIRFAPEQWLTRAQIGDEVPSMLAKGSMTPDARAVAELEEWFGSNGKFPAWKIGNE
jgi:hypothetical protein